MIYIGTDIVPISRIKSLIEEKGSNFVNRIFTDAEQEICNRKSSPWIHFSGKFAAKEAVKKAILSSKTIKNISFKSIEIHNDNEGVPTLKLNINNISQIKINLSISHAGEYATSTAILEI